MYGLKQGERPRDGRDYCGYLITDNHEDRGFMGKNKGKTPAMGVVIVVIIKGITMEGEIPYKQGKLPFSGGLLVG